MLDFGTPKSNSEVSKSTFLKITSFSGTSFLGYPDGRSISNFYMFVNVCRPKNYMVDLIHKRFTLPATVLFAIM